MRMVVYHLNTLWASKLTLAWLALCGCTELTLWRAEKGPGYLVTGWWFEL